MSDLQHITIAQNQHYLAFPDVAVAQDGTLVCAYFEGDKHSPTWSNVVIKTSSDLGQTWSPPQILARSDMHRDGFCWNCPRISSLPDGRLFLMCDWEDQSEQRATWRWYSRDSGTTWSDPKQILWAGLCPDRVVALSSGRLLTTINCDESYIPEGVQVPEQGGDRQIMFCSDSGGETWRPHAVVWAEDEMEGGLSMEDFLKANEPALETTGDVVSMAMILETQSLDLYLRYAHRMSGENAKEILYQLADQEKVHLNNLGRLLDRQTSTLSV